MFADQQKQYNQQICAGTGWRQDKSPIMMAAMDGRMGRERKRERERERERVSEKEREREWGQKEREKECQQNLCIVYALNEFDDYDDEK